MMTRNRLLSSLVILLIAGIVSGADRNDDLRSEWLRVVAEELPDELEYERMARAWTDPSQKPVAFRGEQYERSVLEGLISADSHMQDEVLKSLDIDRHKAPETPWWPWMRLVWRQEVKSRDGTARQLALFCVSPMQTSWSHATMVMTDGNYRVIDWRRVTKGWNLVRVSLECESERLIWKVTFDKGDQWGWWWTVACRIDEDRLALVQEYASPDCVELREVEEMIRESQATAANANGSANTHESGLSGALRSPAVYRVLNRHTAARIAHTNDRRRVPLGGSCAPWGR